MLQDLASRKDEAAVIMSAIHDIYWPGRTEDFLVSFMPDGLE